MTNREERQQPFFDAALDAARTEVIEVLKKHGVGASIHFVSQFGYESGYILPPGLIAKVEELPEGVSLTVEAKEEDYPSKNAYAEALHFTCKVLSALVACASHDLALFGPAVHGLNNILQGHPADGYVSAEPELKQ